MADRDRCRSVGSWYGSFACMFPAFGLAKTKQWTDHSWLLTNLIGGSAARWFGIVLWLAAMLGFIGDALGFYGLLIPQEWR